MFFTQLDPSEKLDPKVEDVLIDIAEDFFKSVMTFACSLAKHRKSGTSEAKDVLLHAKRSCNIALPGFGGDRIKLYKKPIKKSMASEGNTKSSAAQTAAQQKNQTPKPPATDCRTRRCCSRTAKIACIPLQLLAAANGGYC